MHLAELAEHISYLKPDDISLVEKAYQFSKSAHEGQFRKSGEAYISHPVAVAKLLAKWHLDAHALMAALLHDVVEDTPATKQEVGDLFGKSVAELVDGVSKLDRIEFQTKPMPRRKISAKCCWQWRAMCASS